MLTLEKRRRVLLSAAAVGLTLLSACSAAGSTEGAADAGTASVASLATPKPAADKPGPSPTTAQEVLIRPDTTRAERTRLWKVYVACLSENGVPRSMAKMFLAKGGADSETMAKYEKQCGAKEPKEINEKARTSDPDFADHQRAWAKCLNDHGVPVVITKDGDIAGEGLPPESKGHWVADCEQEAFADYYKTLE